MSQFNAVGIPKSEKGKANGVAVLGADGKVPASELNVSGGFNYISAWDAATNTPTLADGVGNNGDMYKVSVAGSRDLGSGTIVFNVGDHVVYDGASWDNFTASEAVSSVAGKTGAVTLVKADVGLGNVDNTADLAKPVSTATQTALDTKFTIPAGFTGSTVLGKNMGGTDSPVPYSQDTTGFNLVMRDIAGQIPGIAPTADAHLANKKYVDDSVTAAAGGGVTSVNGRTGAVVLTKPDVGLTNVDNTSDANKPVSTAQAASIATKVNTSDKASQAEAEAGTDDAKWMTPLKTAQAITALGGGGGGTGADPTAQVGPSTINGVATTYMRSDAAPSINLNADYNWQGTHSFTAPPVAFYDAGDEVNFNDQILVDRDYVKTHTSGGYVLLTSKATDANTDAGTADDKWMTPHGVTRAIANHAETLPDIYSSYASSPAGTNANTPVVALVGPTASNSAQESWNIEWNVYISADAPGTVAFSIPAQASVVAVRTSGYGPAVGSSNGSPTVTADSTALNFQVDTAVRLIKLTTYIASDPNSGTPFPVELGFASPDGVSITVHPGSHTLGTKLMTAN